jgi:hypothetical protein
MPSGKASATQTRAALSTQASESAALLKGDTTQTRMYEDTPACKCACSIVIRCTLTTPRTEPH